MLILLWNPKVQKLKGTSQNTLEKHISILKKYYILMPQMYITLPEVCILVAFKGSNALVTVFVPFFFLRAQVS